MNLENWLIVIPARLGSTRLPRKPLQDLSGKPLIVRVYENLEPLLKKGARAIVATDAKEVLEVCQKNGISCEMTKASHESGSDRCFEVATRNPTQHILNIQGDEPFLNIDDLESLIRAHEKEEREVHISTLAAHSSSEEDFKNPNVCKVVVSQTQHALYFSRSPIPHSRDGSFHGFLHHQGVYAYSNAALAKFCQAEKSDLEHSEKLEQLRALELGIAILVVKAQSTSAGIDTPEDLERARKSYV